MLIQKAVQKYRRDTTQKEGQNSLNQEKSIKKKQKQHKKRRRGQTQNKATAFQFCTMISVFIPQKSRRMETHKAIKWRDLAIMSSMAEDLPSKHR